MKKPLKFEMLLLDFDGTLFQPGKFISQADVDILKQLQGQLTRVIATGRSLYSLNKVIDETFPIDYLIFSTGAGIMEWKTRQIIHSSQIAGPIVDKVIAILKRNDHSFFVHHTLPDNHFFYFHIGREGPADFSRRFQLYQDFASDLKLRKAREPASQVLVITHNLGMIKRELRILEEQISVVQATSPLDGQTVWAEIFNKNTNKALAAQWLSKRLKISAKKTLAIGNDFNDVALLEWAGQAFVVNSAPQELKNKFEILNSDKTGILKEIF